jgi:hypothetical protein
MFWRRKIMYVGRESSKAAALTLRKKEGWAGSLQG